MLPHDPGQVIEENKHDRSMDLKLSRVSYLDPPRARPIVMASGNGVEFCAGQAASQCFRMSYRYDCILQRPKNLDPAFINRERMNIVPVCLQNQADRKIGKVVGGNSSELVEWNN